MARFLGMFLAACQVFIAYEVLAFWPLVCRYNNAE